MYYLFTHEQRNRQEGGQMLQTYTNGDPAEAATTVDGIESAEAILLVRVGTKNKCALHGWLVNSVRSCLLTSLPVQLCTC